MACITIFTFRDVHLGQMVHKRSSGRKGCVDSAPRPEADEGFGGLGWREDCAGDGIVGSGRGGAGFGLDGGRGRGERLVRERT